MISINRTATDAISKSLNSKSTSGKNNSTLYPTYASSLTNFIDLSKEFSTYEMAHWINNNDRWIHNRTSLNTSGYKRGSILFIDLGATNYRYEPSFTHPCIVLAQTQDFILIVPCSSKKYGSGYPEIIDATPADGFSSNTGIQTKSFRWISKNRVISRLGTASTALLDKIDAELLKLVPSHSKMILQKDNDITQLTADLSIANDSLAALQESYDNCKQELELLKLSLQKAEERINQLEMETNN